ncbi:hypothetical protein ACFQ71_41840 [Streptomyces sp. NPDC056534]|uniref:hypothetical protein n=1 Tax=Streptomyces sp. NPDC056534 TaxID=3345857 RepID=UPI00367ACA67
MNTNQIGLMFGSSLLVGIVALAIFSSHRSQKVNSELSASIGHCFSVLTNQRGLTLEITPPFQHSMMGEIPVPPRLRGEIDGISVEIFTENNLASDGDTQTVLRLGARRGSADWPNIAAPGKHKTMTPMRARPAFEQLCSASHRIEVGSRHLIAVPKIVARTDWHGRTHRVELDPGRLDVWLGLALNVARRL